MDTRVLVVAGFHDHTVDYRTSIALAFSYPHGVLFLADDDHQSHHMADDGTLYGLIQAFLGHGPESAAFQRALRRAEQHRWQEP